MVPKQKHFAGQGEQTIISGDCTLGRVGAGKQWARLGGQKRWLAQRDGVVQITRQGQALGLAK